MKISKVSAVYREPSFLGKHHTDEAKEKMSKVHSKPIRCIKAYVKQQRYMGVVIQPSVNVSQEKLKLRVVFTGNMLMQ